VATTAGSCADGLVSLGWSRVQVAG